MTTRSTPTSPTRASTHPRARRGKRVRRIVTGATVLGTVLIGLAVVTPATAQPKPTYEPDTAFLPPYYTELDLTGDHQVTQTDLTAIATRLGATSASTDWSGSAHLDVNRDGAITVADLATVARRMIYNDGPFELVEASVIDMQAAMNAGVTTSAKLTQAYLDRIAAYDRTVIDHAAYGRPLNAIIDTNATAALAAAAQADAARTRDGMTSLLLGIPIAVKDNYDTTDMPTTGGCGCWEDNRPSTDATVVKQLRAAGAVILAKASMDEFAFGLVSQFSTGQPAGSALLVASPNNTAKTAGGSSGGTGAAISANLAAVGFGTDTDGSIRIPSSYNSLVGIRPTVGLTSRDGIIPLALSQDTGGPIARSVTDAAIALDSAIGIDPADPATTAQQGKIRRPFTTWLDPNALKGARIGYVSAMIGENATDVRLFAKAKDTLQARGATVIEVTPPSEFSAILSEPSGSTNEFKHGLNAYIEKHLDPHVSLRSLADILATDRFVTDRRAAYEARNSVTEQDYQDWAGPSGTHTRAIAAGKALLTQLLHDLNLDALVYPTAAPYNSQGDNLRLSPNTGLPAITVPMGQATEADRTTPGANVNLEFLGSEFDEGPLLGLAYAFEQATKARSAPSLFGPLPK